MLLAGWGPCGIPVSAADNTYNLAVTDAGLDGPNGKYYYGGGGSADARDPAKVDQLWGLLEEQAGCKYADVGAVE